jgi:hypothetical protein
MPISFPSITRSGPVFREPIFMPGIASGGVDEGLAEGLGFGIGIFM